MASTTAKSRFCCICLTESDSKAVRGVNICGGCEKHYCNAHYKTHREELAKMFDALCEQYATLLQDLNSEMPADASTLVMIEQINKWEVETIDSVKEAAQSARNAVEKLANQDQTGLKKELETLKNTLISKQTTSEYDEIDLEEWKAKMQVLMEQLNLLQQTTREIKFEPSSWISINKPQQLETRTTNHVALQTDEYFPSTRLLSSEHQRYLNEFLGVPNQQWTLLYRGTRNGLTAADFHRHCDNQGPTITIIEAKTTGYLFGGFTSVPWTSGLGRNRIVTFADGAAFLFTLINPHGLQPTKYPIKNKKVPAVYHNNDQGPSFGYGPCDMICLSSYGTANVDNFPQLYEGTKIGRGIFVGASTCDIAELEVYTAVGRE